MLVDKRVWSADNTPNNCISYCLMGGMQNIHDVYSGGEHLPIYLPKRLKKVQVGNNQEKAQSENNSHSKIRRGKKLN